MSTPRAPVYRCRLCGRLWAAATREGPGDSFIDAHLAIRGAEGADPLLALHLCGDGCVGLSDLCGVAAGDWQVVRAQSQQG